MHDACRKPGCNRVIALLSPVALFPSLVISLLFAACGGGSGGDSGGSATTTSAGTAASTTLATPSIGRFVDAPVQGISYTTATLSGITDSNGAFLYRTGETVTFKVGDVLLGSASGTSTVTPITLAGAGATSASPIAVNIASFLQSLDQNGGSGSSIVIPHTASVALKSTDASNGATVQALNAAGFANSGTVSGAVTSIVQSVVRQYNTSATAVSSAAAQTAMESSLTSLGILAASSSTTSGTTTSGTTTSGTTTSGTTTNGTTTSGTTTSGTATNPLATGTVMAVTTLADQGAFTFQSATGGWVSNTGSFTVPDNPTSLVLHLVGSDVGTRLSFNSLTSPRGTAIDVTMGGCPYGETYCNVMLPYQPDLTPTGGTWNYTLQSTSSTYANFAVKLTTRYGATPATTSLTVQPYLSGTTYDTSTITTALTRLVRDYNKNNISVTVNPIVRVSGSQYAVVSSDFTNTTTSALVGNGASNVVNLFFIEDFRSNRYGGGSDTLGISAGIPGSLGLAGNHNGVLISIGGHLINGKVDTNVMGDTAAHEIGHFLGLFHTTESDGQTHDPLADTPECTLAQDSNHDGSLSAEECANLDGYNLMFWIASTTGMDQSALTPNQQAIIRASPLAVAK
ncbi:MAG: hypothetical protein HQL66_03595 [Magnetococcales bacterium]|nr:hypothetical protein [Magnetococcales bacterium]